MRFFALLTCGLERRVPLKLQLAKRCAIHGQSRLLKEAAVWTNRHLFVGVLATHRKRCLGGCQKSGTCLR